MDIRPPRPKANSTPRAAVYLRISLDQTGEGLAIERQREDCERMAATKGMTITKTYIDNSISASKRGVARPGYDEMLKAVRAGEFEAVICYDLDRLTRQPRQLEDWIEYAEDHGLWIVTGNGEADLNTDGGRMFARMKASVARAEVERKSARQKRALQQRAERGGVPKGARLTGYEVNGELVPSEAEVIKRIFDQFAAGETLRGLCRQLEDSGIATRNGGKWNPTTVTGILKNSRYAGRSSYRVRERGAGEYGGQRFARVQVEGVAQWQAIVSESVFDLVQARLNDPRRKTKKVGTERKYLGSGLFKCGRCGGAMYASATRYSCHGERDLFRTKEPIDRLVEGVIKARLARPDLKAILATDTSELAGELEARSRELLARLETVENDYDNELIDGARYKAKSDKIKAELDELNLERGRLIGGNALGTLVSAPDPAQAYESASLSVKRAILDAFMTVTLLPASRGRKGFDPESVRIEWRI